MGTTLVVGGTGKTGRRVAQRLRARGLPIRIGSPSSEPPFDWDDQATWAPALRNIELDGRNAHLGDGVQRALGRPPRDFADFARAAAATGVRDGR
jgi:uncharacterized protein YbjT (DUF2867 family)